MAARRNIPAAEVINYLSDNSGDEEEFCFEGSDEDPSEYERYKIQYQLSNAHIQYYSECEEIMAPTTTRITVPPAILAGATATSSETQASSDMPQTSATEITNNPSTSTCTFDEMEDAIPGSGYLKQFAGVK